MNDDKPDPRPTLISTKRLRKRVRASMNVLLEEAAAEYETPQAAACAIAIEMILSGAMNLAWSQNNSADIQQAHDAAVEFVKQLTGGYTISPGDN